MVRTMSLRSWIFELGLLKRVKSSSVEFNVRYSGYIVHSHIGQSNPNPNIIFSSSLLIVLTQALQTFFCFTKLCMSQSFLHPEVRRCENRGVNKSSGVRVSLLFMFDL